MLLVVTPTMTDGTVKRVLVTPEYPECAVQLDTAADCGEVSGAHSMAAHLRVGRLYSNHPTLSASRYRSDRNSGCAFAYEFDPASGYGCAFPQGGYCPPWHKPPAFLWSAEPASGPMRSMRPQIGFAVLAAASAPIGRGDR